MWSRALDAVRLMTGAEGSGASARRRRARADRPPRRRQSRRWCTRLFDDVYYRTRSGFASASRYEALEHYLEFGWHERFDPHPLFDTHYYLGTHEQLAASDDNPLLHYLSEGAAAGDDPSPYFDTDYYYSQLDYYYSQLETPARHAVNALVHYVEYGPLGKACNPNPLFDNGYYLGVHSDVRSRGENPSRTSCGSVVWRDGHVSDARRIDAGAGRAAPAARWLA